jgi:hypothetical protein
LGNALLMCGLDDGNYYDGKRMVCPLVWFYCLSGFAACVIIERLVNSISYPPESGNLFKASEANGGVMTA